MWSQPEYHSASLVGFIEYAFTRRVFNKPGQVTLAALAAAGWKYSQGLVGFR